MRRARTASATPRRMTRASAPPAKGATFFGWSHTGIAAGAGASGASTARNGTASTVTASPRRSSKPTALRTRPAILVDLFLRAGRAAGDGRAVDDDGDGEAAQHASRDGALLGDPVDLEVAGVGLAGRVPRRARDRRDCAAVRRRRRAARGRPTGKVALRAGHTGDGDVLVATLDVALLASERALLRIVVVLDALDARRVDVDGDADVDVARAGDLLDHRAGALLERRLERPGLRGAVVVAAAIFAGAARLVEDGALGRHDGDAVRAQPSDRR